MNVTEMLERIGKLPSEWRHPHAATMYDGAYRSESFSTANVYAIMLDLHLRHIAEKLAAASVCIVQLSDGRWFHPAGVTLAQDYATYALALLSAAEAVVKEGGANAT